MGDHEERGGPVEDAAQGAMEGLRVKRRKAFVKDDKVSVLETCPSDIETTPFSVRELPAGLPHHLHQSGRHAVEEIPKAELTTEVFGPLQIFGRCRPAVAHQQVEGEGASEDVVFMELWRPHHAPPPALRPKRVPVEALEEEEPRLW